MDRKLVLSPDKYRWNDLQRFMESIRSDDHDGLESDMATSV